MQSKEKITLNLLLKFYFFLSCEKFPHSYLRKQENRRYLRKSHIVKVNI